MNIATIAARQFSSLVNHPSVMPKTNTVDSDTRLQSLIEQSLNGDPATHAALLQHACDRLLRLTRKMFHGYPQLRRWEQTDDVFQNAMLRLHRALPVVRPESARHFFNMAAQQVRWELLDDLSSWAEFHRLVEKLPLEEQEVVNLLYYQGLTQNEAARLLEISGRTLKRRWQSARIKLYESFHNGDLGRVWNA